VRNLATPALAIVLVAIGVSGCNGSPTAPSRNEAASPSPGAPSATAGLSLVVPDSVAPGETATLQVFDVAVGGGARDVTAHATFGGGPPDVIAVSPAGRVTGVGLGDASVYASYQMRNVVGPVVVVPEGTFRVVGQVVEDGTSVPIGAVRVEADGGPGAVTGFDGRYRLFGVPGRSRLRFSKPGYVTREVPLDLTTHHVQDVGLGLDGPRRDFAGSYDMAIEASPECRSRLPDHLLTRRYKASVAQMGRELRVALSGASFVELAGGATGAASVTGQVAGEGVAELSLQNYGHCEFTEMLIEKVQDGYLYIEGAIRLQPSVASLAGTLNGALVLFDGPQCQAVSPAVLAACRSSSHRVTLTR
jgi:hypothetical protein